MKETFQDSIFQDIMTLTEKNNIGPVVPIIEHNCQDIISLASFLDKMYGDVN